MIIAGTSNPISFKVSVLGTSAEPRVRVILGTTPELSFPATQDGDKWRADLLVPVGIEAGSYSLRVEVVLNGRLFSPITKSIDIAAPLAPTVTTVVAQQPEPAQPIQPAQPTQPAPEPTIQLAKPSTPRPSLMTQVAAEPIKSAATKIELKPVVAKMPKVVAKLPKVVVKPPAPIEVPPQPELSALKVEATKRRYAPIRTPLPMPTSESVEAKPIVVTIADVDAMVKVDPTPLQPHHAEGTRVSKTPIALIKEELFYE